MSVHRASGCKCTGSQHRRQSTLNVGLRSRVKARSDRPRQYLHNDSTAAVHCGARALRDAPHRCSRTNRGKANLHAPRPRDASMHLSRIGVGARSVFRGFRGSCPRPSSFPEVPGNILEPDILIIAFRKKDFY